MSDAPKKFKDLRVADLKVELEKRGLQTSGIKAVLAERLKNALVEEGIDVEEFIFEKPAAKDADKGASDEEQAAAGEIVAEVVPEVEEKDQPEAGKKDSDEEAAAASMAPVDDTRSSEAEMSEEKEAEDDSLNIMVGDEDNLFGEDEKANGAPASPPRPENVPAKHPFTSRDTLSLSSRGNRPPSENSSMRVNPDETQSVASHDSNNEVDKYSAEMTNEAAAESSANETSAKEETAKSKSESDKAKTAKPVIASARNLWVSGLSETTKAKDLKELFSKHGKVEGAKVIIKIKNCPPLIIDVHC